MLSVELRKPVIKVIKINLIIKIFILYNFLILCFFSLKSEEKITPFKIVGGTALTGNLYLSNFTELQGYPSCCQNFDVATGFGYNVFVGGEYLFQNKLLGLPYSADFLFSWNNLSAKYAIKEKLANVITGNDYIEAFSEHSLDASIQSFIIEPGIKIEPLNSIPLSFRVGLKLGMLFGMTFIQEERILSPSWITYKETGTKIKYHYSGDIPNASKVCSALSFGFGYEAIKSGNFSITPIINFNYGLNNITSDLDWKISSLHAGISIGYNIPKPKNVPPQEPPLPKLPEPPKSKKLDLELEIYANNNKLKNDDTLFVSIRERKFINRFILLPIAFYKVNSSEMIDIKMNRSEEEAQKDAYKSAIKYLKENPKVNLTLISSALNTENQDTVKKRINELLIETEKHKIEKDRIKIKEILIEAKELSRKEMEEDNCYIRFDFSDGAEIISYKSDTAAKYFVESVELTIKPKIQSDFKIKNFEGDVLSDRNTIFRFKNESSIFDMKPDKYPFYNNKLEITAKAVDELNNTEAEKIILNLQPKPVYDGVFENVISDIDQDNYVSQWTLGYCEFDKAEFSFVNKDAVEQIKNSINSGNVIEIIPLFDFLGTEEHNIKLAEARANAALNLLGIKPEKAIINIPKDYFFSNDNPYGRMMNRTVIVRIKNIYSD